MRFLVVLLAVVAALPALAAEPIGLAAVVRGTVTAVAENGTAAPLKSKDPVYANQTLKTGPDGQAQLIFKDETVFSIGADTQIVLDRFVYNPDTGLGESIVNVAKGTFRFITGKIAKKTPENVKVKTPFATIGVRGSGGIGNVGPNGEATVGLVVCCLQVTNAAGTVDLTTPNFFTSVSAPDTPPTPPVRFTEAQLSELNGSLGGGPKKTDSAPEPDGNAPTGNDNAAPEKTNETPQDPAAKRDNREGRAPARENATTAAATAPASPPPLALPSVNIASAAQDRAATTLAATSPNANTGTAAQPLDTLFGRFRLLEAATPLAVTVDGLISARPLSAGAYSVRFQPGETGLGLVAGTNPRITIDASDVDPTTFTVPPFLLAGDTYLGRGYRNAADTFRYYDLYNTFGATPNNLNVLIGQPMAANTILTSGPIGFFHFLPDPLDPNELLKFGFPANFLADGLNQGSAGTGAYVDFGRNIFLASHLKLTNTAADYDYRFTVALGRIDRGTTPGFDGSLFDYQARRSGALITQPLTSVGTFESTNFFGQNGYIDAFALDLDILKGNGPSGQIALTGFATGVVAPAPLPPQNQRPLTDTLNIRMTTAQNGFSTGFLTLDVNGARDVRRLNILDSMSDVDFRTNASNDTVGLEILYDDMDALTTYNAKFGNKAPNTPSAYVSNYVYAMQLGELSVGTQFEGMAASEIVDRPLCGQCRFSNWGLWAGRTETTGAQIHVFNLIPYVVGPIAQIGNLPNIGSATYSGSTFGAVHDTETGDIRHHYGTMTAQFMFGSSPNASLSMLNASLGPYEFTKFGTSVINGSPGQKAMFTTALQGANAFSTGLSGNLQGALIGDAASFTAGTSEIIGQFNFSHTSGETVSKGLGVLQGVQQP